ncbi:MAG: hypothetical protein EPN21_04225 [Methylococcaceae bacterium]|nr:MAG: hypothetical protein EPN21_04225 [Methylococcaceae bacterium]
MPRNKNEEPGRRQNTGSSAVLRKALTPLLAGMMSTVLTAGTAYAQTEAERIADLERKLQNAIGVINKLSDKVEQLEAVNKAAKAPKASVAAATSAGKTSESGVIAPQPVSGDVIKTVSEQNARLETLQQQVTQLNSASASRVIPFDWLHGFADAGGAYSSSGSPQGFGVGSLDLYITPKLGGQVRSLAELVFEYDQFGGLATDLERVQLGYAFSDQATVWLGRFHTPYGYWQTAYHHGQQIQPSLLRPRFIDFEDKGGILPAHTVGLWGTGGMQAGDGKFTYDVYAGNTPKIANDTDLNGGALDLNASGWINASLTAGGKVGYTFSGGALDSLNIGLHGMRSEVRIDSINAAPRSQVEMNMAGGYAYYNNYDWEVISEVYGFMNHDQHTGTGSRKSWAGFVHVGRQMDRWMPYARLEKADTDQKDVYFNSMALGYAYAREAAGLRYDINPQSALKLEVNYTQTQKNNPLEDFWESRLQYSIRF